MNNEIKMPKTVKERDDLDLFNLVCELSGRFAIHQTKELHEALVEARAEMITRFSQHPAEHGVDAIEALKILQPYIEDLQMDNHNEPSAGIFYDHKLESGLRLMYKCLGIETWPPKSQPSGSEPTVGADKPKLPDVPYSHPDHKELMKQYEKDMHDYLFASQPVEGGQNQLWNEFDEFHKAEYFDTPSCTIEEFNKKRASKYFLIKKSK